MTAGTNIVGAPTSPPEVADDGGRFLGAMRVVRGLLQGPKYQAIIDDIQTALRVSRRTAECVYAGQSVSTETAFTVLTDGRLGPPYFQEVLSRVEPDRRAAVARALIDAAELVRLRAEHDDIARRIAMKEGGR